LTADVSLPLSSKPQIMFGTGATTSIIPPVQVARSAERERETVGAGAGKSSTKGS
jgi:hypothetical protein